MLLKMSVPRKGHPALARAPVERMRRDPSPQMKIKPRRQRRRRQQTGAFQRAAQGRRILMHDAVAPPFRANRLPRKAALHFQPNQIRFHAHRTYHGISYVCLRALAPKSLLQFSRQGLQYKILPSQGFFLSARYLERVAIVQTVVGQWLASNHYLRE